ncbi:MAG: L,D-transpeptidase family protein, partial [Solirubrobacteraceae bacterium]
SGAGHESAQPRRRILRDLRLARSERLRVSAALLVALGVGALLGAPLPQSVVADRLVIDKSERTLTVVWHGVPLKTYRVALGGAPTGAKDRQGDERTPEGVYTVDRRLENSAFHRALHLSYPDREDIAAARAAGVKPGGDIAIHGLRDGFAWVGSAHTLFDWTDGCIALTNEEIEELWRAVPAGTKVEIKP